MLTVTWVLAIFTGVLAVATIIYAYCTWKLKNSSEEQTKALGKLTEAILRLPSIEEHLESRKKMTEERKKEHIKAQQNTLTGI